MAIQTGLEGKPWYIGLLVGLAVGIGLCLLGYYQFLGPLKRGIESQEAKLETLQADIQKGRAIAARLPQFREEVNRLQLELEKLLRILPARLNTDQILRNVRSLAEQGDFKLRIFEPKAIGERDFYKEFPINITMDGTYHNLALFFDKIRRFPRIFNVENLKLTTVKGQGSNSHTLTTSFTAKTFVYVERPLEEFADDEDEDDSGQAQNRRNRPQRPQ